MLVDPKVFSIWPEGNFLKSSLFKSFGRTSRDIEDIFDGYYQDVFSVLFPSARAGLSAIFGLHLSRDNYVWIPPFASHCVISSVGLSATPTPFMNNQVDATLVFHQWGYVHKPEARGLIIEDSVDTLIERNGHVFPNDGRYELLSLPKIFGSMFGGIVLCQNREDAQVLRRIREERTILKWQHVLNKLRSNYSQACLINWNQAEPENGFLPAVICEDIYRKIIFLDRMVINRKKTLDKIESLKLKTYGKISKTRFPTCLALDVNKIEIDSVDTKPYERHFSLAQDFKFMTKVLPIAIHKDVNLSMIETLHQMNGK
jgi:putative PLP-dependent aminotransferase (TIGR04422 family)